MPRRPEGRARSPEAGRRLILEGSPTTLRGDPQLRGFVESVIFELNDPISPDFARSVVTGTSSENVAADLVDMLVAELVKVPAHVWKEMFASLLRYDDLAELPLIEAPTLLIWGDADTLVTREMQNHLTGSMTNAELLIYPDVGHTPRWEDPVRFSNDIATFVQQVGQ